VICLMTLGSRPSEKLGTHSMSFCIGDGVSKKDLRDQADCKVGEARVRL
jgi:hypothetical protein